MLFNVARLLKEPVGSSHRYRIDHAFGNLADTWTDHAQGQVTMVRVNQGIWVNGSLEATTTSFCSRCLTSFPHRVQFQLDEVYVPMVDINAGAPVAIHQEDDGTFIINQNHVLDLHEAMRQYTIMSTPMKPLCQNDCEGMCQRCGVNLNGGACWCLASSRDPHWAPLQDLPILSEAAGVTKKGASL